MSARRLAALLLTALLAAACADATPPEDKGENNNPAPNNNPNNNDNNPNNSSTNNPNNNTINNNNSSNNNSNNSTSTNNDTNQNNSTNNNNTNNNTNENNNPLNVCEPNPCVSPPNPACEGDTRVSYAAEGTCEDVDGGASCTYEATRASCADQGQLCQSGACVDAPLPQPTAGQVVFTEVLYDPHFDLSENTAEWFELTNLSGADLDLSGCTVRDATNPGTALTNLTLPAGGIALLVRSGVQNGGLTPDHLFDFALDNAGDTLTLTCEGQVIDSIDWRDADFPRIPGRAAQVGPGTTAEGNDVLGAWCTAPTPFYRGANGAAEDNYGTPGEANPSCPVIDTEVDWCRMQAPASLNALVGEPFTAYGRVFEEGLSTLTAATDADPTLRAQVGFGPRGSAPADNAAWAWSDAAANPGWDASAAAPPEPGNDEYLATLPAPAAGAWDLAFRFSRNSGPWLYCDLDARAQGGADGAADGYNPDQAARLTTAPSPCTPNPCVEPPDPECSASQVATRYTGPGTCSLDANNNPSCDFAETVEECAPIDRVCMAGECVEPALPIPAAGEVILNEIMFDTHYNLNENTAEWIELHNTTATLLSMNGCTLVDAGTNSTPTNLSGLTVAPGGYLLLARSSSAALNGGLQPAATFSYSLNNTGSETLTLRCGDAVVDAVTYTPGSDGFPATPAASMQLNPSLATAADNDLGASWCRVGAVYYADPEGQDLQDHYGTPGAANPPCAPTGRSVGWCRYQYRDPQGATLDAATPLTVYARLFIDGLTSLTPGIDPDPFLRAQAGYGPQDSHPGTRDNTVPWRWFDASPTPDWSGPNNGEAPNDEYRGQYAAPAAGSWELAFRYSIDGGITWLYCDKDGRGQGRGDGATDGYNVLDADKLTTE